MKTSFVLLLTGVVLGLLGADQPNPELGPVDLVGRVTDASTGEPVEGVQVVLRDERSFAQTNGEGVFLLRSEGGAAPRELSLRHPCYHTVRVEVGGNPQVSTQRIEIGVPFDYEQYHGYAPPLGGCERR